MGTSLMLRLLYSRLGDGSGVGGSMEEEEDNRDGNLTDVEAVV